MNRIKLFFALCLLPVFCAAAEKTPFNQRIFIDGNEQAFAGFPSFNVKPRMVRFVLPEDYDKNSKQYPAVYVLGESRTKNVVKSSDAVFIFIPPMPGDDDKTKFSKFLDNELIPYAETNYRLTPDSRSRLLAARAAYCDFAADIFAVQRKIDNLALIDASAFNVNFSACGRLWLSGDRKNILAVNPKLAAAGFVFGKNMLYSFTEGRFFNDLPLNMIFGAAFLPSDFTFSAAVDMPAIPAAYDGPVNVSAKINLKNGMVFDYIINQITFSADYFNWEPEKQAFFVKTGAKKGGYKAAAGFGGKKAKIKFKLY